MTEIRKKENWETYERWCKKLTNACYIVVGVIFSMLVLVWALLGYRLAIPVPEYWARVILLPSGLLLLLNILVGVLVRRPGVSILFKIYAALYLVLFFCFALCIINNTMVTLLGAFCIPVFVSSMFSSKKITTVMYVSSQILLLLCALRLSMGHMRNMDDWLIVETLCASGILLASFYLSRVLIRFSRENRESLQKAFKEQKDMRQRLQYDTLTLVFSRSAFDEAMPAFMQECREQGQSLCLAILDLDYFKQINDTFGHGVGDVVLKKLAEILLAHSGEHVFPYRIGGEEFALLFKDCGIEDAFARCDEIREVMGGTVIQQAGGRRVTFSAGVADMTEEMDIHTLFNAADTALYCAKNAGRNQVSMPCEREESGLDCSKPFS